jgi:hypothetical protein
MFEFDKTLGAGLALALMSAAMTRAAADDAPAATPYRPTVSNPANLSEPGWLEVELGWQRVHGGSDKQRDSVPVLAKLAFTPDWGVLIGGDLDVRSSNNAGAVSKGVGDTTITLKHRIHTATEGTAFGIELGYKSPTAPNSSGSGSGKADYIFNGIYSTDFSGNHLDLNLGATRLGTADAGQSRTQHSWAASLSRELGDKWGVFSELSGTAQRGVSAQSQLLAGASYNVSKRVVLDAGMTSGLAATSQDWSVFFGVTILAGKLW